MSGLNLLSDNLVDNSTLTLTTGTANAQYPLSNILNESSAKKFRSTGNTAVIEFDLGVNRDIDVVGIVGDSLSIFGITTATFKTSLTTDFSGSPVHNVSLSSEHNIGYVFITEVSHRYVELTLTGSGSYVEFSNIFIGKNINIPLNSLSTESFRYWNIDRSSFRTNDFNQKFIDIRNTYRLMSGTVQYANKTEFELLDDFFLYHGKHKPFWVILDPNDAAMNDSSYRLSIYCYLDEVPQWSANGGQHYSANLKFRQAV